MKLDLSGIMKNGKFLFLAYDQGLEHGPTDFNDINVDPNYVLDIAIKGKYNAIILQKGIAEKYYSGKIPLILKLNGKTNLVKGDPLSVQVCSVKKAIELGAKAVGYTIYIGSIHESQMFHEFKQIQEEAHNHGLPVIAWMYPRGKQIRNDTSMKILAYAARVGLELGADIVKLKYGGNVNDFKWVVKSAGKTKVVVAGGSKSTPKRVLQEAYDIMLAGASGMAIGRNIWQYKEPLRMTKALKSIIFKNKNVRDAMRFLK